MGRGACPDGRFAASTADAGLLLVPGGKMALAGSSPDVEDILDEEQPGRLDAAAAAPQRASATSPSTAARSAPTACAATTSPAATGDEALRPPSVSAKFNAIPGVARVYTNGPITVFDLGAER